MNVSESNGREKLLTTLRGQVTAAAPEHADAVLETLLEAMQATKRAWGTCGGCGQRVELQVMDATAAVNAARVLMEQAEGRPGVASGEEQEGLTIVRAVYDTLDASHALSLLEAGKLDALRAELASSLPVNS